MLDFIVMQMSRVNREKGYWERTNDDAARDDAKQKMDLTFTLEFRKQLNPFRGQNCLNTCSN